MKDTSVNYQVVGTAQPGQDFEPLLGTALLRAGQTSVTVTLRSIQKDVVFLPTDMIVGQLADPRRAGVREGRRPAAAGHADPLAHRSELHGHAAGVGDRTAPS